MECEWKQNAETESVQSHILQAAEESRRGDVAGEITSGVGIGCDDKRAGEVASAF